MLQRALLPIRVPGRPETEPHWPNLEMTADMTSDDPETKSCCLPAANRPSCAPTNTPDASTTERVPDHAVLVPGGIGLIGTDTPFFLIDGEGPLRKARIKPFRIGATTVTNAEFAVFVEETGFVTEAERFGWSFVFWAQVPDSVGPTRAVAGVEWWRVVEGASWRDPNGPGTGPDTWHPDHPVVHVSWNDATAFARWAGGRLPTEAEWEHAARGGLGDVAFPWGVQEPNDTDYQPCNIWQGRFPDTNLLLDGHDTTAPAHSFDPNGYGLFNMVGNVWEWTSETYRVRSLRKEVKDRLKQMKGYRLSKGGSFLCHKSYCFRYRIAARSGTSPDSTTTHQGFRVVWPA